MALCAALKLMYPKKAPGSEMDEAITSSILVSPSRGSLFSMGNVIGIMTFDTFRDEVSIMLKYWRNSEVFGHGSSHWLKLGQRKPALLRREKAEKPPSPTN